GGDAMLLGDGAPPTLPSDFTKTDLGGFKLGPEIDKGGALPDAGVNAGTDCNSIILGVVRDFRGVDSAELDLDGGEGHPDFEAFWGSSATKGLVEPTLGSDEKPVYTGKCEADKAFDKIACPYGQETTTKANFDEWYRNTPNVNIAYLIYFF